MPDIQEVLIEPTPQVLTPERVMPLPRYPAPCWRCKAPSERQGVRFLLCPHCQSQEDIERQEVGDA
jgi:hypothetical protein